jgi:hypothetical protein
VKIAFLLGMALATVSLPAVALADDPNDPAMRSSAARARDREAIRQLNLQEAARVRERDARYAEGWSNSQAYGAQRYEGGNSGYADGGYAQSRADYQRELAAWRHAVSACRAGDYSYCAR